MPSAARREVADEPKPDMAAVAAKADRVLDAMLITAAQVTDTLNAWGTACPQDSRAVPHLQSMSTEIIGAGLHCEELRQEVAKLAAGLAALDAAFAAGRELERGQARQEAPGPRHAAERSRKRLRVVRDLPVAAFAGAAFTGLRHAWAAHPVYTAAAGFTTVATLTAATAVVAPHAAATFGAGPSSPAPAASIYSAVPAPSQQRLIASVSGRKGSSGTLTVSLPPSVPSYAPQDPSVSSGGGNGQDPSQPSSQPAPAPEVKLVVPGSLDLGTGSSGTIRITAYGGTVSWSASTSAGGLSLDSASGTLAAGDSATITVSIGADLQALTGPGSVTITYGDGKTAVIPVSWTVVPLPVPTVAPTDVAAFGGAHDRRRLSGENGSGLQSGLPTAKNLLARKAVIQCAMRMR